MAGGLIAGVQSRNVIATLKHFALNAQEMQRNTLDVTISASAMRQSDLMAFEIANEVARPVAVMCSYNLVNGSWACENDYLLNDVLKRDWGFKGFAQWRYPISHPSPSRPQWMMGRSFRPDWTTWHAVFSGRCSPWA